MPEKASESAGSIYLIDAHSLIYQVFHAIPEMSSPSGLPTNAIFGFARDLLYIKTEKRPDYLVVALDPPGPVFRNEIYPEYKAHRPPPPNDLILQIPEIHRLLEALRVPNVCLPGFEADDVLATLARAAELRGLDVVVCTSDKDCRQLIDDHTQLLNLRKRSLMGRQELLADWGITPEQVVDLQSLVGDSTDNVPGVPGIGMKTAAKLLQDFGTIEGVLANIGKITGAKRQENLRNSGDIIKLSRSLVKLATDAPVDWAWDQWRLQDNDVPLFVELCREWGFRSLADQVRKEALTTVGTTAAAPTSTASGGSKQWTQPELFPFGANASDGDDAPPATAGDPVVSKDDWQATYRLVDDAVKFQKFLTALKQQARFAIDLETTSLEPRKAEIVGYAICWQPGEAWYLPVRGPETDALLDPAATLAALKPLLEDPAVAKINQNVKFDRLVLRQQGVTLNGVVGDPMVADYLLHAGERSHGMDDMAVRYLNHRVIPISNLIGKGKAQKRMDQVPTGKVAEYSGEDADVAWRLCDKIEPKLEGQGARKLYDEVEIPLIEVLAELEFNGIRLDVPLLAKLSEEMTGQLAEIEEGIYKAAGRQFNIASPKQLREVLFNELNLPRQRRTGITGESSTNQETLERLAALGHELPRQIVRHRQVAKLKGTYVDALPALVNPATGRVHASFNQTVASTGRLSSSDPNLQNVPVRTEQGRQIRAAFVPEPGWVLLTADWSQIELRLLAHFSGDVQMRQAFAEDQDVHATVAAQIYGVPLKDVTSDMRRVAKTVNFGVIYGMSAVGLAQRLEIPRPDAAKFIDAYFAKYPKVLGYQGELLERCRKIGYTQTILGRRRAITGIRKNSHYSQRNQPEREAINMEIQGSAADLMKLAMLNLYRKLKGRNARMLLTVHDELVLETPPAELKETAALVEQEMTSAMKLEVPLKVDMAAGKNWLDVEDV